MKLSGLHHYPDQTVNRVSDRRFESNEEKGYSELTLEGNRQNITLQYGVMEAYEQTTNTCGTKAESEFMLTTPGELRGFTQLVNAGNDFSGQTVKLRQDVDVSAETWEPIGAAKTTPFKGSFDGAGHQVTYKIDKSNGQYQYQAFFSYVEDAQIRNPPYPER